MVKFGLSVLLLSAGASACAPDPKPLTQLILVADTDLSEIDRIEFTAQGEGHQDQTAEAARAPGDGPSYVAIVRKEGSLGPLTVTARGFDGEVALVERVHQVSFVQDETRVVPLHLVGSCRNARCGGAETCSESGCVDRALPATQLAEWSGQPPGLLTAVDAGTNDAGTQDAGTPDARGRDAGTLWRQCDGRWVDLLTEHDFCGTCTNSCRAQEDCVAGACVRK